MATKRPLTLGNLFLVLAGLTLLFVFFAGAGETLHFSDDSVSRYNGYVDPGAPQSMGNGAIIQSNAGGNGRGAPTNPTQDGHGQPQK